MIIHLKDIGKKYNKNWIFRNLSLEIVSGSNLAITGSNGSGKSTLIKILSGYVTPTKGKIIYSDTVSEDTIYEHIGICAPYIELVEEMNLVEAIEFHSKFKSFIPGVTSKTIQNILGFDTEKYISEYSSGMKQRLKLALTIFSDVQLLLLDEPTSNFDLQGIDWYSNLVNDYKRNRTLVIASNDLREYNFCTKIINIAEYK